MSEKYHGWTNYATWNVDLWVTNVESTYNAMRELRPYDAAKAEQIARELFPEGTPDMDSPKDMDKVNWEEIAEAWNAE